MLCTKVIRRHRRNGNHPPPDSKAVSSPLGKGTAEMHRQKQLLNQSNKQFFPLLARGSAAGEEDKITRTKYSSPARQQAVSSPLEKGTAEMQ